MGQHAHHHPDGSRPPLVFVRTWGVEGDYLGALAEHVDPDQPIIGIDPPSAERCAGLDRVGDWVAYEREQLDSLALSGPYRLSDGPSVASSRSSSPAGSATRARIRRPST